MAEKFSMNVLPPSLIRLIWRGLPRMSKIFPQMIAGLIAALFFWTLADLGFFDWEKISRGLPNLIRFSREAFPPDMNIFPAAGNALLETVQMAFAGTLLGFFVSFPLAVLGARNLVSRRWVYMARVITGWIRTIPPLLWAIVFVIIVGLGPLAGTLSLALYTAGYLPKLYGEFFESADPEVLEAVKGAGASMPFLVRFVILPESANVLLSQLLFMFEYNIRASSILGFVGAGGIGFQIYGYLQTMEYQKLTAVLILIFAIVLLMDYLGGLIRRRYLLASV